MPLHKVDQQSPRGAFHRLNADSGSRRNWSADMLGRAEIEHGVDDLVGNRLARTNERREAVQCRIYQKCITVTKLDKWNRQSGLSFIPDFLLENAQ